MIVVRRFKKCFGRVGSEQLCTQLRLGGEIEENSLDSRVGVKDLRWKLPCIWMFGVRHVRKCWLRSAGCCCWRWLGFSSTGLDIARCVVLK
jgi:hypothetical protein